MRSRTALTLFAVCAVGLGGCKSSKSSTPLSPSVAGPIAGVEITAPKALEPGPGWQYEAANQPLTLLLENAASSGVRPLTYTFEVSFDPEFSNKAYSKGGVSPGEGGRTSLGLPDPLASDRTYYWRARAEDGANSGPYSAANQFTVFTPVVLQAPGLQAPINDVRISGRSPVFRLSNAARTGPVVAIRYLVQVSTNESFTAIVATLDEGEQPGATQLALNGELAWNTRFFWRARARETSKNETGPWSGTARFITPVDPAPAPTPDPPDTPSTGGPYPSNGRDLANWTMARYPGYLRPVSTRAQRIANMVFLRDRMIEAGTCGGMRLGWNCKRGDCGNLSNDYVTFNTGGRWIGVDIAADYDNNSSPLQLHWLENPADTYAHYTPYTNSYTCK